MVLGTRWVQEQEEWVQQFLVRWDGSMHDTWESRSDLERLYPTLNLEDKVLFDGEGNFMSPPMQEPRLTKSRVQ